MLIQRSKHDISSMVLTTKVQRDETFDDYSSGQSKTTISQDFGLNSKPRLCDHQKKKKIFEIYPEVSLG